MLDSVISTDLSRVREGRSIVECELRSGMFKCPGAAGPRNIGAEWELFLVDRKTGRPRSENQSVIDRAGSLRVVPEVVQHALEVNADVLPVEKGVLTDMHRGLDRTFEGLDRVAKQLGAAVVSVGTLPTARQADVSSSQLSENPRYRHLLERRRSYFGGACVRDFTIPGVESLPVKDGEFSLVGLNSSFQIHVEVSPRECASWHNRIHALMAPILAFAANSTYVLGHLTAACSRKPIWIEAVGLGREDLVPFAGKYLPEGDPAACLRWMDRFLSRERCFVPIETEDPLEALREYLCTYYPWARLIIERREEELGMRWEIRPFCAPMSARDAIAIAALTLGALLTLEKAKVPASHLVSCEEAKANFESVVLDGMAAPALRWYRANVPIPAVLSEIINWAEKGLLSAGCSKHEVREALLPVRRAIRGFPTGSEWVRRSVQRMRAYGIGTPDDLAEELVQAIHRNQHGRRSVTEWSLLG